MMKEFKSGERYANKNENNNSHKLSASTVSEESTNDVRNGLHDTRPSQACALNNGQSSYSISSNFTPPSHSHNSSSELSNGMLNYTSTAASHTEGFGIISNNTAIPPLHDSIQPNNHTSAPSKQHGINAPPGKQQRKNSKSKLVSVVLLF